MRCKIKNNWISIRSLTVFVVVLSVRGNAQKLLSGWSKFPPENLPFFSRSCLCVFLLQTLPGQKWTQAVDNGGVSIYTQCCRVFPMCALQKVSTPGVHTSPKNLISFTVRGGKWINSSYDTSSSYFCYKFIHDRLIHFVNKVCVHVVRQKRFHWKSFFTVEWRMRCWSFNSEPEPFTRNHAVESKEEVLDNMSSGCFLHVDPHTPVTVPLHIFNMCHLWLLQY